MQRRLMKALEDLSAQCGHIRAGTRRRWHRAAPRRAGTRHRWHRASAASRLDWAQV
jgi:hypothetical protein